MGVQINGSTGAVTGTQSDWSGNVSIGGTLTYEDVTNIDAVGLVTARSGIEIGARPGVGASISADGNMIVSGISTFSGYLDIRTGSSINTNATGSAASGTLHKNTNSGEFAIVSGGTGGNNHLIFYTSASAAPTEKLRITSGGDFCVGKTSATGKAEIATSASEIGLTVSNSVHDSQLQILASAADKNSSIFFGDAGDGNIGHIDYDHNDNNLNFKVNGSERVRINSAGNLIIADTDTDNATTDSDNLVIGAASGDNGMTIVSQSGNYNGTIRFSDGANTGADSYRGTIQYYHGDNYLRFYTDGAEAVRISSGNQLSVNTTSTNSQFTINSASATNAVSIRNTTLGNGHVGILFSTQDHSSGREKAAIYHVETHGSAHYKGDIAFCLNTASGGATQVSLSDEKMRVTSSGELKFASGSRAANTNGICAANGNSIDFNGSEYMYFRTANAERMRIDASGNQYFTGMTSLSASGTNRGINMENSTNNGRMNIHANSSAGNALGISFYNNGANVGTIYYSASATAYNTSSDYRLKENQVAISDGIARLKNLKPCRFNFKVDPTKTVDGFFAHEVTPIIPEAVTGEKDAEDMQQLDYAKLTPLLTAALQEAIAKIETLETEVAALKSS